MKGMELAREFYYHCLPVLMRRVPDLVSQATFGLAGEGSECFGCDDDISRDHDFGAGFCVWLEDEILKNNRARLEEAISWFPPDFKGYPSRFLAPDRRVGPMGVTSYYASFTGLDHPPRDWREWLGVPEERLAAAVNGEIFDSGANSFMARRKHLLDYYPRDVWLKKLAAAAMNMAQAGQYNLPRQLERCDGAAAFLAAAKFAEAALSMVYLFNRRYKPFYKHAPRLARNLPILGRDLTELLDLLASTRLKDKRDLAVAEEIENFCSACAAHLRAMEVSDDPGSWLWTHGPEIISRVEDPAIKATNLLEAQAGA
ncbi:MAG: DUF4037 domain-containing protein [Desulfovibrio sp.]|nr:DUF4037 domain-containing protein [Desulfovibrio sp.]